jgi:voltage-gated potassium channel
VIYYVFRLLPWSVLAPLFVSRNPFRTFRCGGLRRTTNSTTCGYGNLEPTTTAGQLFTVCFAIYGVIILGVFIGIFGNFISETQTRAARKLRKRKDIAILDTLFGGGGPPQQRQQTERFDPTTNTSATTINVTESERFGFDEYYDARSPAAAAIATTTTAATQPPPDLQDTGLWNDHVSLLDDVWRVVRGQSPVIALVGVLALILGLREGWSFMNTLYFSIMAATTTGFGDYTPRTQADKLYSIFFLPLAVAVFSEVLGRIATVYIRRKQRHLEAKHLHRTMTLCDLRNMDTNTDGAVDREEFILFMLQALQKVDRSTVQKLPYIFDGLDRNGNGILEYDDLIEIRQSNYLPALEQVEEAVARQNGLLDHTATKGGNGSDDWQPRPAAGHRRTRTSP